MRTLLSLLLGSVLSWAGGAALASSHIGAEMAALDRAYIPTLTTVSDGKLEEARRAMSQLMRAWRSFMRAEFQARTTDPTWRKDCSRVQALIEEADTIVDGGVHLVLAQDALERGRDVLRGARSRSGMEYYIDYLTDFQRPASGITAAVGGKSTATLTADDLEKIRRLMPHARDSWSQALASEPGSIFALDPSQREELRRLREALTQTLNALDQALIAEDKAAVLNSAAAVRPALVNIYAVFGDFTGIR